MKKIISSFALSLLFFSLNLQAQITTPVISANGFSCTKSQNLVTCQGQFPGSAGVSGASGNYGVQMTYDAPAPNRSRSIYDSTTGCLMQINQDTFGNPQQAYVRNSAGSTQSFPLPMQLMQAYQFCRIKSGPS